MRGRNNARQATSVPGDCPGLEDLYIAINDGRDLAEWLPGKVLRRLVLALAEVYRLEVVRDTFLQEAK